jgi:hypothetical protein
MPALVAGISLRQAVLCRCDRDGRDKPGHDAITIVMPALVAGIHVFRSLRE